jgi:predicted metal-binding protein
MHVVVECSFKMSSYWFNRVTNDDACRSKIQGLGLYAARDLERHTMVIEYIGEVIRTELSELREKLYEARVSCYLNCSLHCVLASVLEELARRCWQYLITSQ